MEQRTDYNPDLISGVGQPDNQPVATHETLPPPSGSVGGIPLPGHPSAPAPGFSLRPARYSMKWLGEHAAILAVIAVVSSFFALILSEAAHSRSESGLLSAGGLELFDRSLDFCSGIIGVTLLALLLVDVASRRHVTYLQYILVAAAQVVFYMLLLSLAGLTRFGIAYIVAVVMTVGQLLWFVRGITRQARSTAVMAGVLLALYGIMGALLYLGSMALLTGSLVAFGLVGLGMYFTLKLRVENGEIFLK